MGMSNDYTIAIEEGATYIRLGTVLVGKRVGGRRNEYRSKVKYFFFLDEEYADSEKEQHEEEHDQEKHHKQLQPSTSQKQNVVSLQSVQKSSKVVLVEPRIYSEAQGISDQLKSRRAVVVNLQRIELIKPGELLTF